MSTNQVMEEHLKPCVVVLGSTGTGKTTTLNVMTGSDFATGNNAESVTTEAAVAVNRFDPGMAWIDCPGLQTIII